MSKCLFFVISGLSPNETQGSANRWTAVASRFQDGHAEYAQQESAGNQGESRTFAYTLYTKYTNTVIIWFCSLKARNAA